ncbi:MAG: efflux RND transporter permease subunit, partial [Ruminococcaceae bacterium]|nr:efflux RND transporter permease subunit [Oscillospiraceae bacterium]
LYSITIIGTAFIPEIDSPQMSATLVMPDDSDADTSKLTADQVSEHILTIDAVAYVGAMSGGSSLMGFGSGGQDSRSTSFYILLQEKRDLSNHDIEREISRLTEDLPGEVSVSAANMNMGMLGDSGITVQIRGQDFDMMGQVATEVIAVLQETDGIAEVVSSLDQNGEELRIIVDKDKAMRYSLTVAQIYQKLATALQQEQQAIVLTDGIENIPVLLKPEADKALTRENLGRFVIEHTDQAGVEHQVQLNQIARIETASSLQSINRENQSRYLEVSATLAEGHNIGLVSRDLEPLLQSIDLPTGISLEISGENAMIHDALGDLFLMLALAVLFIYLIMVAQFQSLLSPFIVLFTLPLAFTGGQLLLWILGMELSVIAALGFLVLAGVVVNNGIVFVSTVNQLRENRMERKQALLETGVLRLRPILMTAFTTILAMITMAAGFGQGAEMTQPMAVVTIGGLLYATVLTLYVVPLIYDVFHKRHLKQADVGDTELDGSDSRTAAQDRLAANHDDSEVAK